MKRVFLVVLDSFGIGTMPDGEKYGDRDVNTLRACVNTGILEIPNLRALGLGNIDGVSCLPGTEKPAGAFCRMAESSAGKDTTIGHWEIAGLISRQPLPTYPEGFPQEVISAFCHATGRGVLANCTGSGTVLINQYGDEHVKTGNYIVYTSADSVFQVAAHEDVVPLPELYDACRKARGILQGKHGVGRVIARPFVGESGHYVRTANRHDFSLEPPGKTLLDALQEQGFASIAVGKIRDIFAGRGITDYVFTSGNRDGMEKTAQWAQQDFTGLCFVNLVDFDMLYGHRRNPEGYARALNEFDAWMGDFLKKLGPEDVLIITADHGCDPAYGASTDHTREYVPLLVAGKKIRSGNLGTVGTFATVAATVAQLLGAEYGCPAEGLGEKIVSNEGDWL